MWESVFNALMLMAMILTTPSFSAITIRDNDVAELQLVFGRQMHTQVDSLISTSSLLIKFTYTALKN